MNHDKHVKVDTLDFIFEYIKDAPEKQLLTVERLDNKVIQILSVATILVGLVGLAVGGTEHKVFNPPISYLPYFIFITYVFVVIISAIHLKAKKFRRSIQADTLWNTFWKSEIAEIKLSLVKDIGVAYKHNKDVLATKTRTLLYSLIALGMESALILIFILFLVV